MKSYFRILKKLAILIEICDNATQKVSLNSFMNVKINRKTH